VRGAHGVTMIDPAAADKPEATAVETLHFELVTCNSLVPRC
jgi:hypothetical protein